MEPWTAFPRSDEFAHTPTSVRTQWDRLHAGDAEPCPDDPAVLQAWALLHSGAFEAAAQAGHALGEHGLTVAHKATVMYANYLEPGEAHRIALFSAVADSAAAQAQQQPDNANAWFWHAYALARYSQGISVAKALAQGFGSRVRSTLERVVALAPLHADAHLALGAFHAEVIDKVGPLIGRMTYGASKEAALEHFSEGLRLHPRSIIGRIEYANALVMLDGEARLDEATALYEAAAATEPLDALESLAVALAQMELAQE